MKRKINQEMGNNIFISNFTIMCTKQQIEKGALEYIFFLNLLRESSVYFPEKN